MGTQAFIWNSATGTWEYNQASSVIPPLVTVTGKQLIVDNTLTLSGTDNAVLNIGNGGILGTAAFANSNQFQPAGGGGNSSCYYAGSLTIGTGADYINITVNAGLSFSQYMWVLCAYAGNPTQFMYGYVDSYVSSTGALKITVPASGSTGGSGSYTGWNISVAGAIGPVGATGSGAAPVGSIEAFAGASLPTNYLWCQGAEVSRSTYSGLFGIIGTTWGVGDGSTTFNLPNLQGRFPLGAGQGLTGAGGGTGTNRTLGQLSAGDPNNGGSAPYGSETHTQSSGELVSHNHADAGHTHAPGVEPNFVVAGGGAYGYNNGAGGAIFAGASATATGYASIGNAGSGAAMNIMPPFGVVNYIIRYQ